MTALFAELNTIAEKAKKEMITITECNQLMEQAINAAEKEYRKKLFSGLMNAETLHKVFYIDKQKAYHRMYKLLFDLTKG